MTRPQTVSRDAIVRALTKSLRPENLAAKYREARAWFDTAIQEIDVTRSLGENAKARGATVA